MSPPVVLLLTAEHLPGLAADDQPLLAAFRDAGWEPRPAIWSGPVPDADLAIIRSCWDYTERVEDFLGVVDGIAERMPLWNPADTVRWNADKHYLLELRDARVPVPELQVVEANDPRPLAEIAADLGTDDLVLKPTVGASGKGVARISVDDEVTWRRLLTTGPMLVQRFVPEVLTEGEWSLMYFHGEWSHAVRKRARTGEFRVQEEHGGTVEFADADAAMLAAAERALAAVPHPWMFARVDGVRSGDRFLVMELELIEPQLFLAGSDAAGRLVPQ